MYIARVTEDTLKTYYNKRSGYLLYNHPHQSEEFQLADDLEYAECLDMIRHQVEFIYVEINWRR